MTILTVNGAAVESLGLAPVQRRRKLALLVSALLVGVTLPFVQFAANEGLIHETVEMLGIGLIALAIVGRSWCTLYIGGRKSREIVATGPYSVSRNPLYLFSFTGVAGIAAQTGSLLMVALLVAVTLAIFMPAILGEEKALAGRFGAEYAAYRARVPRFGPRLSAWTDMEAVMVSPKLFWRTAREGLLFFLVIPVCEGIEWLQETGRLVPFIHLP